MIPEMVVAMLKASVGWIAGRSVAVGITKLPREPPKLGSNEGFQAGPVSVRLLAHYSGFLVNGTHRQTPAQRQQP